MGSRGGRKTGGREETSGGGGEMTASGGRVGGGTRVEGTGVADRGIAGGILVASTEGGEAEGGGHGRPGGLPWLLVKGD